MRHVKVFFSFRTKITQPQAIIHAFEQNPSKTMDPGKIIFTVVCTPKDVCLLDMDGRLLGN
jgi:hypothetical protein